MSGRAFLDTNVAVYLFDGDAPDKQTTARRLLAAEGGAGSLVLSTQVLQEFYVSVTRKLSTPLSGRDALDATRALGELPMVRIDPNMVYAAIECSQRHQLSFWDGLIVQAAVAGACTRLLTEDLQHGQEIDGVRVENPFG